MLSEIFRKTFSLRHKCLYIYRSRNSFKCLTRIPLNNKSED